MAVERRLAVQDLSEFRLEWNSFWSWCNSRQVPKHLYTADWAKLHNIKPLLKPKPGLPSLLLGEGPYHLPLRVYPTRTKPQLGNVLTIGPSQCGKSTKEKAQIADWDGSVVVNDIKDELRPATAGWRNVVGEGKVYTVDFTGRRAGNCFDPLEGRVTEGELYRAAKHLLYNPEEKEKYWTQRATWMLSRLFLAARILGLRPLPFVARLLPLGLNHAAARLGDISHELASSFLEAEYVPFKDYDGESRSRDDAWTTLSAALRPILTPDILRTFQGSDFSAEDILFSKEPVTVYFCWPEEELEDLQLLIKFVWESLVHDIKRLCRLYPNRPRQKLLLSLDEAGITGLPRLPEDIATLNGRGVSFSLTAQDIEQFTTLYGQSRAKTLMNNIESKITHRQASYDTIRYFQLLLDYKSGYAHSNNRHGELRSEGESEREVPLLTVRQFQELDDEDVVILYRDVPPIWARRLSVTVSPVLEKRLLMLPPPLPALSAPPPFPAFPTYRRSLLGSGHYRISAFATGYPIPLPASG